MAERKGSPWNRFAFPAWVVYDFANSLFSINVFGLYFILWFTAEKGASDLVYSIAYSGVMLAVAVFSPVLGAISDRSGRRLPFLIGFTLLATLPMLVMGRFGSIGTFALLFILSQFGFQASLVFYNTLMVEVADGRRNGTVSGLGVAANYLGQVLGILLIRSYVEAGGRGGSFLPSALYFLVFALPCFFLVRDTHPRKWERRYISEGYQRFLGTLREARRYRAALLFLLAFFLYEDAIATLMHFPTVYLANVAGFNTLELQLIYMLATALGVPGAILAGWLADRLGARRTVMLSLIQWVIVFILYSSLTAKWAFFVLAAFLGIHLGWIGAASRVTLVQLVPREKIGEFFGLFSVGQRFGAVVGPLIWGVTVTALADYGPVAYRGAALALLVTLLLGCLLMLRVPASHTAEAEAPAAPIPVES